MSACIFCEIVAGAAEASVVYEDAATLAFMNLRQQSKGHVLVIPKAHVATIYDLDSRTVAGLFQTVVRTARAVERGMLPAGLNILQNNREAAGQDVFHVHVHIIPRRPHDGLLRFYPEERRSFRARPYLDHLAAIIKRQFV